jgi:ATP-dependent Lon protease
MPEDSVQRAVAEGNIPQHLPILPLSGAVLFPQVLVPLILTEPTMVELAGRALGAAGQLALLTVRPGRSPDEEEGADSPFYDVGTLGVILQHGDLPDGAMRLLIHGRSRLRIQECAREGKHWFANVEGITAPAEEGTRLQALHRIVLGQFLELISALPQVGEELRELLVQIREPGQLADFIGAHLNLEVERKQELLEEVSVARRLERLAAILGEEQKVLEYGTQIQQKLKDEVEKTQREFWLREQLRIIQQELGETEESDAVQLRKQIEAAELPPPALEQADRELRRLERTIPQAPDYHIIRSYLEWMAALPWSREFGGEIDLKRAREVLDRDHYDREEVKERIIEYLAVRKLNPELHGPILCFVGPPGVGKTSLGQSIADALGRAFTRISLGGIRDEAEIRGHRRTYIGALPGRILRGLRQVGQRNPVFVLDEIDKIGQDFRGDPSSALLEVLDPAQNHSFSDHYLEVAFDLSKVTFIATANTLQTVPPALQDRLEVIELPGYTALEKAEIARRHLIPRQLEQAGLPEGAARILDPALDRLISEYTREPGVRELERQIARLLRRVALRRVEAESAVSAAAAARGGDQIAAATGAAPAQSPATDDSAAIAPEEIGLENLVDYLGKPRYTHELAGRLDEVGTATALAYSPEGGQILFIEAVTLPGGGEIRLTGQLGDVMKESAQAALSYVESHATALGIGSGSFGERDVHVHVPAGATPKDGPSAGVALVVALASLFSGRAVRRDVAMTGEVTLRGHVLPVGGTKEKLIAAAQAGITTVLLPRRNEADLDEVPQEMRERLHFILIDDVGEALKHALRPDESRGRELPAESAP